MIHDDATGLTPLWPYAEAEASCYKGHAAPAAGCRCGIYGAIAGTLDSLPGYLCDTAYEQHPWAYGEIACYGRVFVDMRGVRAQRARLLRIAFPEGGLSDEAAWMLSQRYGVPVGGVDVLPPWVSANRRDEGGPPDDAALDLDLRRLGLSG